MKELHKHEMNLVFLKRYIFYDGHNLFGFTLRLEDDTFCTQKHCFYYNGKGTHSATCHITCIQWYAGFRPSLHFKADHVAWTMMFGGRAGTVSISAGGESSIWPKVNIQSYY